ncbi:neutral amino acid transporter 9-like [Prorops nasuta]|uniref:neutral amino acid transporter 9-like n=1 Tax=Prorops nasuta TaxID=863751 RepID=UPI0034CE650E
MFKSSSDHWYGSSTCPTSQDSGSESTPLISSESYASSEQIMFHNSDTSDVESAQQDNSPRYGSVEAASYSSTATVLPRRFPPLLSDRIITTTNNLTSPLRFPSEKYYEINNMDLYMLSSQKLDNHNNKQHTVKDIGGGFLPGSLAISPEIVQIQQKEPISKQSSLVTVFSIWNTILGSSLLTMPWGIGMAGFFPGIILILLMSGLCLYTVYLLLSVHKYYGGDEKTEVIQLSRIFFGSWAEYIARVFSMTVLLGAVIAYWILMSNFLYHSVNFFYDSIVGISWKPLNDSDIAPEVLCPNKEIVNSTRVISIRERSYDNIGPAWDLYKTVPIFLAILIFPLLNFNSTTFFTKFNSLGTASILYIIVFVIIKSMSWGINMDSAEWDASWILRPTFPALSGMLALAFFIHNIIITIVQSNRDQSKNGRDLAIAYVLVTLTYLIIGVAFFVCFPLAKSCIEDNLLNNFQKWDGLTVGARTVLLFQLLTVYPLLSYMLRIQVLSSMHKPVSSRGWTIFINSILILICVLFAMFMPHIGTILRYTGAVSGFIYVFTLPCLLHLAVLIKKCKLTILSLILHLIIPIIGGSNLIAQFFINDH